MAFTFMEMPNPIIWWQLVLYLAAVGWGAFIIGCFGVGGGAVFVPTLLLLPGVRPADAVATVFLFCLPMTLSRVVQLWRYGVINVMGALPLMLGASAGALLGQAVLPMINNDIAALIIAFLAIFAGVQIQKRFMKEKNAKTSSLKADAAPASLGKSSATSGHRATPSDAATACDADMVILTEVEPEDSSPSKAKVDRSMSFPIQLHGSADACFPSCLWLSPRVQAQDLAEASSKSKSLQQSASETGSQTAEAPVELHVAGGAPHADSTLSQAEPGPEKQHAVHQSSWKEVCVTVAIGCVGSFLSSVSGTGGPLVLFPLMMFWKPKVSMKQLVGLSSPFSSVLVTMSAIGGAIFSKPDLGFALIVVAVAVPSNLFGGFMMERLGDSWMKLAIGIILIVVGLTVAVRTALSLV
eukprot:TRINITY_DN104163_c0_g1_i1.p1 TRINITY_DN104163_c0_g1~~TRINITY_DN104163_c0_g1_i1.p1  ORF type:complete len:411 (-),score=74.75 TRINITY_DN104163_c0_g1_i1:115-1347(-)